MNSSNGSNQRPRIMMISTHGYVDAEPELGLPDTGGQVVYVLELAKCFGRMGYDVDIFTRRLEGRSVCEVVDEHVRILRFPCGPDEAFIPKEQLHCEIPEWANRALRFVIENSLQYTFVNSHYWDAGIAGQLLANRLNVPHLHTPHSIGAWKRDNMEGDPAELEEKYNFQTRVSAEQRLYRECDRLIATTPIQRDVLHGPVYGIDDDRIHVIPPGYDDTRFFPVSRASRSMLKTQYGHHQGRLVLALGRLAENKGYDLLIQAMPFVFKRFEDVRLLLAVGSTELNEHEQGLLTELKELARSLQIEDRVIFDDYIPDDALADYYRLADVFALSSRYEPFGMTAVEAMACGTPTLVTTEGGLWEQVTWGLEAVYANPFDPEAYGHAICMVLGHQRVADQLAKFGSQKARARFTWTGIAQQILGVFDAWQLSATGPGNRDHELPARQHAPLTNRMLDLKPLLGTTPAAVDAVLGGNAATEAAAVVVGGDDGSASEASSNADADADAASGADSSPVVAASAHRSITFATNASTTASAEDTDAADAIRGALLSDALDTVNHPVLGD